MHQHGHDENNAQDQGDQARPADLDAHLAVGIPGSQPPHEQKSARESSLHKIAFCWLLNPP